MLLQLMGFSLPHDDLPGETTLFSANYSCSAEFSLRHSGSDDPAEEAVRREQRNLIRVKRVFDQLSNNTGRLRYQRYNVIGLFVIVFSAHRFSSS